MAQGLNVYSFALFLMAFAFVFFVEKKNKEFKVVFREKTKYLEIYLTEAKISLTFAFFPKYRIAIGRFLAFKFNSGCDVH